MLPNLQCEVLLGDTGVCPRSSTLRKSKEHWRAGAGAVTHLRLFVSGDDKGPQGFKEEHERPLVDVDDSC